MRCEGDVAAGDTPPESVKYTGCSGCFLLCLCDSPSYPSHGDGDEATVRMMIQHRSYVGNGRHPPPASLRLFRMI
jgi:hypothetical protein